MLLRICLILTIVAGLATAYLGFFPIKDMINDTRAARDDFHTKLTAETQLYTKTEAERKKTKNQLDKTTAQLTETKTQLDAATARNTELEGQNTKLTDDLKKMTARADTAEQELERWRELPPPETIKSKLVELTQTIAARDALIGENKILNARVKELDKELNNLVGANPPVLLPEGLKGKVLAVDPKYDFVVLNIGDDQGVKERGEMVVDRNGKLIGRVRITSVEKDRSIATIMPEWKRGQIMEGDQVLYFLY